MTVGTTSSSETMPLSTCPAGILLRPADHARRPEPALPAETLLSTERRGAAVGPGELLGSVVGREDHQRVLGDAELVELAQQFADHPVELLHPVGVNSQYRSCRFQRSESRVHTCMRVELCQRKNGLPSACARSMKSSERASRSSSIVSIRFRVSGPVSPITCLPDAPEARILARIVDVRGLAVEHATGLEDLS